MTNEVIVGILSLSSVLATLLVHSTLRRYESKAFEADADESRVAAITQLSNSLLEAVEKLAKRDLMVIELRQRIEVLEASDAKKNQIISQLQHKIYLSENARLQAIEERDEMKKKLNALLQKLPH